MTESRAVRRQLLTVFSVLEQRGTWTCGATVDGAEADRGEGVRKEMGGHSLVGGLPTLSTSCRTGTQACSARLPAHSPAAA